MPVNKLFEFKQIKRMAERNGLAKYAAGVAKDRIMLYEMELRDIPGIEPIVGLLGDGASQRIEIAQHATNYARTEVRAGREEISQSVSQSRLGERAAPILVATYTRPRLRHVHLDNHSMSIVLWRTRHQQMTLFNSLLAEPTITHLSHYRDSA